MGTKENRTLVILHIAVLLAGWTGLFGRLISLGGLPLVWYRMMVSVVVLALLIPLYTWTFPGANLAPQGNDVWWLLLLGSVFTVLPFLFQLQALRTLSAFTVNLTYNLEPVYSIAFAALLFGEYLEVGFSFWLGIVLIVLSVLIQSRRILRRKS